MEIDVFRSILPVKRKFADRIFCNNPNSQSATFFFVPQHIVQIGFATVLLFPYCSVLARAADPVRQSACAVKLAQITPDDPAFARLTKIYRKHLRFGGTVHSIIPRFHATYEDVLKAKKHFTEHDIPLMVYDLARVKIASKPQTVAIGILTQFGSTALPCIDAALAIQQIKGRVILTQIKISIEAAQASIAGAN